MGHRRSSWSITAGSIAQIPIRIHLTFLALLAWLVFGSDSPSPLNEALYVILIFICVLLHELGHALTAKRFDIETHDITLYPFGGVASITSQPAALPELLIALAGPLVNVVIAGALYPFISLPNLREPQPMQIALPERLFLTNVALAAFNLLPALPMDGGRVLRALLTILKVTRATAIAARVSQGVCILLAVTAVWFELPMLFIISLIIFAGAMQEHVRAEATHVASSFVAEDAMIPRERLECFIHGTTVSTALKTALTSFQPLFPVLIGADVIGFIAREELLEYAATHSDTYIGEIVDREFDSIDARSSLSQAYAQMEKSAHHLLQVTRDGVFVGLLSFDRVTDFLFMHEMREKLPKQEDTEWQPPL